MKCYQLWQCKRATNKLKNKHPFLQSGRVIVSVYKLKNTKLRLKYITQNYKGNHKRGSRNYNITVCGEGSKLKGCKYSSILAGSQ